MASTMYLWSPLKGSDKKVGDKVTAKDVGGADEFDLLVSEGVIRDLPYPIDLKNTANPISPVEHVRNQLRSLEVGAVGTSSLSAAVDESPAIDDVGSDEE